MVYVADLVDAANSEQPPTLRVAGGPAVASDTLLENLQPIAEPAQGEVVGWLPSRTGPQHWGGANFAAYDPGSIAAGPFPRGRSCRPRWGWARRRWRMRRRSSMAMGMLIRVAAKPRRWMRRHHRARGGQHHGHPAVRVGRPVARSGRGRAAAGRPDQRRRPAQPDRGAEWRRGDRIRERVRGLREHARRVPDPPERRDGRSQDRFPRDRAGRARSGLPILRPGGGPVAAGEQVLLSDLYDPASCSRDRNSVCS